MRRPLNKYQELQDDLTELTLQVRDQKRSEKYAKFHGDSLIGNQIVPTVGTLGDLTAIFKPSNWPSLTKTVGDLLSGNGLDGNGLATIAGSLSDYSTNRQKIIDSQVKSKYDAMLHPPLTYLGDAFQYRTADGKFNSVVTPHLGQAGAPYAKTVPSKTAPLGALPDPGDLFDKLMARQEAGRVRESGLSAMLIYHATIIIHDIFRTNDNDKNISDSSSYLDLSPLYGYTDEMQRQVRDGKFKLGLLKPDTFAEDRLLRQPPGVCIMLVMYNRYHNYAAGQLKRINENGRFSVPRKFEETKLVSLVKAYTNNLDDGILTLCQDYEDAWKWCQAAKPEGDVPAEFERSPENQRLVECTKQLEAILKNVKNLTPELRAEFERDHDAAWKKLDDDLFNTARLITCGMYIQVSVHDYLRALMGFHQFDTNFTLDPRADFDQKKTSRGIGNQVTVEFNLLYRFHCAISLRDEKYTEQYMEKVLGFKEPKETSLPVFLQKMGDLKAMGDKAKAEGKEATKPWDITFGIPDDSKDEKTSQHFTRNSTTGLFNDEQMIHSLTTAMDDPISNFGPRNVPKCLKAVEIMGIMQARKWEVGTLNDFRDFFGLPRHATFESVTKSPEIQNALRDLYEHPDKIELYPGIFCESDEYMGLDPGPSESSSALWSAIFSDAITLVRSDRFYTVDWNTNSLTSWGMKEVTPDNNICKSSVFHRLLQRAFPGWFPYNTIRFFHPFYTAKQNAAYAEAQGYGPQFKETQRPDEPLRVDEPERPEKPWNLEKLDDIKLVLLDNDKNFMNPALLNKANLPKVMAAVLSQQQSDPVLSPEAMEEHLAEVEGDLKKYLDDLMRYVIKRESIAMTNSAFQIDATRDFAIPVVTRYVADFLGFGDKLRTTATGHRNTYSENEIYQHITNCQTFLTYNTDETKLLKRRNAFKNSLAFLTQLTEQGNIFEANRWGFMAWFSQKEKNPMAELGVFVAGKILDYEKNQSKAAAILLLICLDFAYNAVVSFTVTLDEYMKELYDAADDDIAKATEKSVSWLAVQSLAFGLKPGTKNVSQPDADELLRSEIEIKSQATVRLPIVRQAIAKKMYSFGLVQPGQRVMLNLAKATDEAQIKKDGTDEAFLTTQLSIAGKFSVFQPKEFSVIALTSMIKFIAQMRNPRRGHDAQGELKRIHLSSTSEGYSNFMAPERVDWIEKQVKKLDPAEGQDIFTEDVLRPEADTYLTPTWDEMVPFPMTWKIRFDGFGPSDYSKGGHPYAAVKSFQLPDDTPPFYQPQGPSHTGGTFAGVVCVCADAKVAADASPAGLPNGHAVKPGEKGNAEVHEAHCPCVRSHTVLNTASSTSKLSTGCGLNDHVVLG